MIFLDITDKDENSHEKVYHLSLEFQADWMSAKSFCSSYGMGLASLESQHEMQYFTKASEGNYEDFEKVTLIGAIFENNEWTSTDFGFKLKIEPSMVEEIDKDGKCLSLIKKGNKKFSYGKVACTNQIYPFICQRMIIKMEHWSDIFFGR